MFSDRWTLLSEYGSWGEMDEVVNQGQTSSAPWTPYKFTDTGLACPPQACFGFSNVCSKTHPYKNDNMWTLISWYTYILISDTSTPCPLHRCPNIRLSWSGWWKLVKYLLSFKISCFFFKVTNMVDSITTC